MHVLFQRQRFPLQKVTNILTLFLFKLFCFIFIFYLFSLITIVCFIPAPEISTIEGNKYLNAMLNYCSLFYCYSVICWEHSCVLFQLQRYPLQKVTNMLALLKISIFYFFLLCCNLFWLITILPCFPAPEISTTEGSKYVDTIWTFRTLFYFPVFIFLTF